MIRHIFIAAWRNMVANRFLSVITILGLVIGIISVLLTTSLIRGVYQENEFLADYQRTFILVMPQPVHRGYLLSIAPGIAPLLKANIPDIENAARANIQSGQLRHGNVMAAEPVAWADPSYFAVLSYPIFKGDARAALSHPDGVVLTRALARKYFGRDEVLGETILLDGAPMTIRAVLQDPPRTAGYQDAYFYASALSARSRLTSRASFSLELSTANTLSYLRLKEGVPAEAVQRMAHAILAPAFTRLTAKERAA
jgi:putative ABC transport system permease protein